MKNCNNVNCSHKDGKCLKTDCIFFLPTEPQCADCRLQGCGRQTDDPADTQLSITFDYE